MGRFLARGTCAVCGLANADGNHLYHPPGADRRICHACYLEEVGVEREDIDELRVKAAEALLAWNCQKMGIEDYHLADGPHPSRGRRHFM